jgi:hypothetical protein
MAAEFDAGDTKEVLRATLIKRLEKQIDLPAWLVTQGYHLSPTQPDPTRLAMADRYGETIHLRKDLERDTWTYTAASEPAERGTVVDLMVRRDGVSLDEAVNRMAACLDRGNKGRQPVAYRDALSDRQNDLHRAAGRHVEVLKIERSALRDLERLGVNSAGYDEWRFGRPSRLLRNPTALENSRYRSSDRSIVFVERPIDAVAFEQKDGHQHACFIYTGDNPDVEATRKIARVLAEAPASLKVVLAFARDRRGTELADQVAQLTAGRQLERRAPEYGVRWADEMQIQQRHRESLARLHGPQGPSGDPVMKEVRRELGRAVAAGVDQALLRTAIVRRPSRGLDR